MDLRLIIVLLTVHRCYSGTTTEDPTTAANVSSVATTTAGGSVTSSTKPAGPVAPVVGSSSIPAAETTTAPKLTCKFGKCTDTIETCVAFKTTKQCAAGEVCGLVMGNGNATLNTYDFSCSTQACSTAGMLCCNTDNCIPSSEDNHNSGASVHINFVTFILMLSAMLCFF